MTEPTAQPVAALTFADLGVQRERAHHFYRQVGMRDDSLHFRRPIPAG